MNELQLESLNPTVAKKASAFLEDILRERSATINSIHIVGSAVTSDFDEKISDINSIIILKEMDLAFVRFLAPLGKKYSRKGIAAPLLLTPDYIDTSLDVFPIEFLDLKLIHKTVYGADIFKDIKVEQSYLRLQCEHEIKKRIIALRQGYISSLGDRELISRLLSKSITGRMPLFRAIIFLLGKEPPVKRIEVINMLQEMTGIEKGIFEKMLMLKAGQIKPSGDEIHTLFEHYYRATVAISKIIDELQP